MVVGLSCRAEDLGTGPTQNSEDIDQKRISESHRPDLDWLRVLAVLLLIPFHAAVAFNPEPAAVILVNDRILAASADSSLLDSTQPNSHI